MNKSMEKNERFLMTGSWFVLLMAFLIYIVTDIKYSVFFVFGSVLNLILGERIIRSYYPHKEKGG